MASFKQPQEFRPLKNPAEDWEKWRRKFTIYYGAAELSLKKEEQQRDILLHVLGDVGVEILETMSITIPQTGRVTYILDKISQYYKPYKNTTFIRYTFFTATQGESENIDQFVADLYAKAKDCEFGNLNDSLVRDRIICGIRDEGLRVRLLRESNLTLIQAIEICRAYEISKAHNKLIQSEEATVHYIHDKKNKNKMTYNKKIGDKDKFKCNRCGKEHKIRQCPAFGKKCNNCQIPGHYASMCKTKNKRQQTKHLGAITSNVHDIEDNDEYEIIASLMTKTAKDELQEWYEVLQVNGDRCRFKLDSGSQINVLPKRMYDKLNMKPSINKGNKKVVSYSGHTLPMLGSCICNCINKKGQELKIEFELIDTELPAILGLETSVALQFIRRINALQPKLIKIREDQESEANKLVNKYKNLFEGIGKLPIKYKIRVNSDVRSQVSLPRRIPSSLQQQVKKELDRMIDQGIIEKVSKPTNWVNPMLIKNKKSGGIRICLDPRRLNEAIKREHLQIPTQDELLNKLVDAKVFTVLDARSAFHQIELDENSSYLCTFATPYGRYRFKRLPFGIKSGPEVFQSAINMVTQDLPGVVAYFDDILVYGKDSLEHNKRLQMLLERAKKYNLTFDKEKLQLACKAVTYLGHEVSGEGMKIHKDKLKAIQALKSPTDKRALQRVLGLFNYVSKFVPGLSGKTSYLRGLLKKNIAWVWDEKAEEEFSKLKELTLNATGLVFFDKNKQITISADASQYGLGAVMMQEGRPVAYASASLTNAQKNYSQIEKELLAILFSLKRFHYHVYGRQVTIQTDHKPLISLQHKPIECMSPRIQRMMVMMQRYDRQITYVPEKSQIISDPLSRDPEENFIDTKALETKEYAVHSLTSVTPERLKLLQDLTKQDKILTKLKEYIYLGWPKQKEKLSHEVLPYWEIQNELHISEDLVFRGTRLVIPAVERENILTKIHASHLGMSACKERAREVVYWPGLNKNIEEYVRNCYQCQKEGKKNNKQPLLPHPVPTRPWEKIGLDFFELSGIKYIVAIDYFSKYIEIKEMMSTRAEYVIDFIKEISARYGIPNVIYTDNGPPFDGQEFKKFMKAWDSQHQTSSPLYARANGMVERFVQTCKKRMRCMGKDNMDIQLLLLNYRSTPHNGLVSPAEALMGRKIRTLLPTREENLKPNFNIEGIRNNLLINQQKQKDYANKTAKDLKPLNKDQPIVFLHKEKTWNPGTIQKIHPLPRSYIIQTPEGKTLRRNRIHIKPVTELPKIEQTEIETPIIMTKEVDKASNIEVGVSSKGKIMSEAVKPELNIIKTRSGRIVKTPARFKD